MSIWYGIVWILAAVMACWSFSICVRLFSEFVARKRKRLQHERSGKAFWVGFGTMLLSAAGSVFAVSIAFYIERQYGSGDSWVTPMGLVGGSVGVFALCLLIWAVVGDRSRGRVRCPKCWYDMSAAAGLKCSECGHAVRDESAFLKSRRPRWAFIISGLFIVIGATGIVLDGRVRDRGYLSIMPDWMMLMGWESYPDHWVCDTGPADLDANLTNRITRGHISAESAHSLGEELFDRMLSDQEMRWAHKNAEVLRAVFDAEVRISGLGARGSDNPWVPSDGKLDQLLVVCARDILGAAESDSPNLVELKILAQTDNWFSGGLFHDLKIWVTRSRGDRLRYTRFGRRLLTGSESVRKELSAIVGDVGSVDLVQLMQDDDQTRLSRAISLLNDTENLGLYIDEYLELGLSSDGDFYEDVQTCHGIGINQVNDTRKIQELEQIADWIEGEDAARRKYAIDLIIPISRSLTTEESTAVREARERVIESVFTLAMEQRAGAYSKTARDLLDASIKAVTAYDMSGRYAFVIVSESVKRNGEAPESMDWYQFFRHEYTDERIRYWLKHFEGPAVADDPAARLWVARNFPERVGSAYDQQLDSLLGALVEDEDLAVADEALNKQNKRYAASR